MSARNILLRASKYLGKAILGLLVLLLITVAVIHLPFVQRLLTPVISDYLSTTIKGRVEIAGFRFSILGDVSLDGLELWSANNDTILSAGHIEVVSNIIDLVEGNLIFDTVRLSGINGRLIEGNKGLNIQFILDALRPTEPTDTASAGPVHLQFKNIVLENIVINYASDVNGVALRVDVGKLVGREVEFSDDPNTIKANLIDLERSIVTVMANRSAEKVIPSDTTTAIHPVNLDLGIGIDFKIASLKSSHNDFSYHVNQVATTPKFDPNHLELKNIQGTLSGILVREDTLAVSLNSFAVRMPGFELADARGVVNLNRSRMSVVDLRLASATNEISATFSGANNTPTGATAQLKAHGRVTPADFVYFLSDSSMRHVYHWHTLALDVDGRYERSIADITTLSLKTENSELIAQGTIHDMAHLETMSWQNVRVNARVGSDFEKTLAPFLGSITIPTDATLELATTGNKKRTSVDGRIFSTFGNVKASGLASWQTNDVAIDINVTGEKVEIGKILNVSSLGPMDLAVNSKGKLGNHQDMEINGAIDNMEFQGITIRDITIQNRVQSSHATSSMSIEDPAYRSTIISDITFGGPIVFKNDVHLQNFNIGNLWHGDSTLLISGDVKSSFIIDRASFEGKLAGNHLLFQNHAKKYPLDTLVMDILLSPGRSSFTYLSDDANGKLNANFDIRDVSDVVQPWYENILSQGTRAPSSKGERTMTFDFQLDKPDPLQLVGLNIESFSAVNLFGELDEQSYAGTVHTTVGKFKGYGMSVDSLRFDARILGDSLRAGMKGTDIYYNTIHLGNLDFGVQTVADTTIAKLLVSKDSMTVLDLLTRISPSDSGVLVYTDKLRAFDRDYAIDPTNAVHVKTGNTTFNNFLISRDDVRISLNGDVNAFELDLANLDLSKLNYFLYSDSTVVNYGLLNAKVSYVNGQQIDLHAGIDSLCLYDANPLTVELKAVSDKKHVPFEFSVRNKSNNIELNGEYFFEDEAVDAALNVDIQNLELTKFMLSDIFVDMRGAVKGKAKVRGPIKKPGVKGNVRFINAHFTTVNPALKFAIKDDSIAIDDTALELKNFTIFDPEQNPLVINGKINTPDYKAVEYDLKVHTDKYTVLNNPDSVSQRLRGLLVVGSDVTLTRHKNNTNVKATITVKDSTAMTFVASTDDIKLINSDGVIEFVDPQALMDSVNAQQAGYFYDSLIASLPDFNLNSTINIEKNAGIRINIDEQSGDFIQAHGGGKLELDYDRTGNVLLSGTYTIEKGVYRVSFYDLVKKNFNLVPGSSITWSGNPQTGDLDIKAVYIVRSSSIGLIGNEIAENEKSTYSRALPYEVGITIKGTIASPLISFSLDLPQEDKTNYPVLANKLDRLRQPEFQSELNKQVFGVLVLGGFLPESTGINQNVIATTALSNSVNALLSSQLNRFANQYVKGIDIDVGIQSYSDYGSSGGKTKTAMDFKVTKRVLDDRLSFEIGGDFNINQDQSGTNTGDKNFKGDVAIIYDLTGKGNKKLKLFNNETYDIIYQEIRNTGVSLIFIREFDKDRKDKNK